jgi:hypothetical protein
MIIHTGPLMRKVYYVGSVNFNTPTAFNRKLHPKPYLARLIDMKKRILFEIFLDKSFIIGIIYLTIIPLNTGVCHGCKKEYKNPGAARAWIAQSSAAKCDGQDLYRKRIFRFFRLMSRHLYKKRHGCIICGKK